MNWRTIAALVVKDVTLFSRNRFFAVIGALALVAYVAIYHALPSTLDEVLEIGLYGPELPPVFAALSSQQGLEIESLDSDEALRTAVTQGQYQAGVVLEPDFWQDLQAARPVRVQIYFAEAVPLESQDAVSALVRGLAYSLSGQDLNVQISRRVLGRDMAGRQVPLRDRMLPLIAVLIVLTEMLGLASLISEEIEQRTIRALLVTPMRVRDLFLAKGMAGVGLAFGQALLFMLLTGGLGDQPLLVLAALFLGSVLVTGIGFGLASMGKDLLSVIGWGIPVLIILMIPAFGIILPGVISDWAKLIPSYYFVDTVYQAANLNAGWEDLWAHLLMLLGFNVLFIGLGVWALRRKFA
jgi:ABC-type multidrug transport system permease subunit